MEMQYKSKWVKSESMVEDENRYERDESDSNNSIKYSIPLKPRVDAVINRIDFQVSKLEIVLKDLKSKDDETFRSAISSVKDNKTQYSQYSGVCLSDLVQIRKLIRMVILSKVVFENLNIKLSTVSSIVDLVSILSPAVALVKNIRSSLISYMPESKEEVGSISGLIGGILVDAAQIGSYMINFETANEKASHLMTEASLIAERKIKEEFADIPDLAPIVTKD
jgi:division protein CdvB (Snf7/Vps24/ESCRT-III family)